MMTIEQYNKISAPFRGRRTIRLMTLLNRAMTYGCYLIYPVLLIALVFLRDERFWRAVLVPGISFVLLSVFRKKLNAPRPYQVLDITPLIPKDTRGKSMPSRHIFCVFMIAASWCLLLPWLGILLAVMGVLMAIIRVIAGIHFPRDVIAGALVGILAGWLGYCVIP